MEEIVQLRNDVNKLKEVVERIAILMNRNLINELNEEAIRLIKLTDGKWSAGLHDGKKVNVLINIPVKFTLP